MRVKRLASILLAISLLFGLVGCTSVVDTTPPTIPGNISKTTPDNDNTPTFTWDAATDATSGITSYQVRIDSDAFTDIGNVTTYTVSTALPDGAHTFEVRAVDKAGNQGTAGSLAFTIDTTAAISLDTLTVHFIDVGQGDSILVDFGSIEVLIDGGGKSPGVVSYIDDYVDGPLEVVVATHPHADHIGGLIDVLAAFEVQEIWYNGDTSTSKTYSQFMLAINSEGAEVYEARRGNTIEVGGLVFDVLHPMSLSDTTNNNSIVLSLSCGEIDFLFTGDAEQQAEASMITAGLIDDIDILKVAHHGSKHSSTTNFLAAAQPEIAIYSAGATNPYGHPAPETITRLCDIGATIYGTDVCGTIIVVTDGNEYTISECTPILPPTTTSTPEPSTSYYPSCSCCSPNCMCYSYTYDSYCQCSGATAICNDGTCSFSKTRSGTCSWHGGVKEWINCP
jgi:beta-lactamase superfamily II metal-dependent hydrolase